MFSVGYNVVDLVCVFIITFCPLIFKHDIERTQDSTLFEPTKKTIQLRIKVFVLVRSAGTWQMTVLSRIMVWGKLKHIIIICTLTEMKT